MIRNFAVALLMILFFSFAQTGEALPLRRAVPEAENPAALLEKGGRYILLSGVRYSNTSNPQVDTATVIAVYPNSGQVHLVAIHPDYRVVTEEDIVTLTGAYRKGGSRAVVAALEHLLDIDIDYYGFGERSSFAEVGDLLGGLELEGKRLSGKEALDYLFEESVVPTDKQMQSQEKMMKAVASSARSRFFELKLYLPWKAWALHNAVHKAIDTNANLLNSWQLVNIFGKDFKNSKTTILTP